MIRSIIDIGTNTILMMIGEFNPENNSVNTLLDIQRVPRLGKGVDKNRNILPESIEKAVNILNEYKALSSEYSSEKIIATATSFIRDSHNKQEFLDAIKEQTGISIQILPGADEAKWTFVGGVYDKLNNNDSNIATIDIGGGSTEITTSLTPVNDFQGLKELNLTGKSMNIGSVRINEKYLSNHPPAVEDIVNAENFINENLKEIDFSLTGCRLIGVAGTITTLGAIILGLDKFDPVQVDGLKISFDEISSTLNKLIPMPVEELYGMGDYMTGRADIVIPGILILKCFMQKYNFNEVTVSTKGLRYGVFLKDEIHLK